MILTFTESGDRRSSSLAVDDTGEDSDDFVGRPMRFFVRLDEDPFPLLLLLLLWLLLLLLLCVDCDKLLLEVCVDGMAVFIVIGGIL